MADKDNSGLNRLARVMQQRMRVVSDTPAVIDIGQINEDYSLKTNLFPLPIPASDYLICRSISYNPEEPLVLTPAEEGKHPHGPSGAHSQYTGDGVHSHPNTEGAHIHTVPLPEKMRMAKPGDRVLVVWVGNDAVVIDILIPAKRLEGGANNAKSIPRI